MGQARPSTKQPESGYTLVAMVVIFSVMTILMAAVLPSWTRLAQREKEEELIFRGLQYAEAIRVFQLRFGRYPVRLQELLEVQPRTIRQLWKDPMTEKGDWGLIFAQATPQQRGRRRGQQGVAPQAGSPGSRAARRRRGESRTVGPIIGVHSLSSETAIKSFLGGQQYSQWQFTVNQVPAAQVVPGTLHLPSVNSRWIGRPFPEGLGPQEGSAPTAGQPQQQLRPGQRQPGHRQPGRRRQPGGRAGGG